jgi:2-polyprenyl-3-methyl-5-hydroxy-6-metoxy-1,4-benzoquinol methylase
MKSCIICGQTEAKAVFTERGVKVMKCRGCGHVFSSFGAPADYGGYFGEKINSDNDHFWWQEAHEKMYDDFCRRFIAGRGGKLLDVGCGLGYFLKKISPYPSWTAYGCEISRPAAEFARDNLHLKNIHNGRTEDAGFAPETFDIITLWDVIEHIPDPHSLLAYLHTLLKPSGFIFMHTPNVKIQLPKARLKKILRGEAPGVHLLEARDHINLYSAGTMRKLLAKNNFTAPKFIHLHPIQSAAGSRSGMLKFIKNLWFRTAVVLDFATFHKINIDNLFVIAKK